MRLDMRHALRHDERLPNPSALAGARWSAASVDTNPSHIQVAAWANLHTKSPHHSGVTKLDHINPTRRPSPVNAEGKLLLSPNVATDSQIKPQHQRASQPYNPLNAAPVLVFDHIV